MGLGGSELDFKYLPCGIILVSSLLVLYKRQKKTNRIFKNVLGVLCLFLVDVIEQVLEVILFLCTQFFVVALFLVDVDFFC